MNEELEVETVERRPTPGRARHGRWVSVAVLGAVLLTAAACSSGSSSPSTTSSNRGSTSTPTTSGGSTTSSSSSLAVNVAHVGSSGLVLVDRAGLTLYRYTPDGSGKSNCNAGCATVWPPLTVPAGTTKVAGSTALASGSLATITRSDGTLQVTYKGMPLYTYSGDMAAGQANGQGAGGIWFVVPVTANSTASTSTTTSTVASGSGY